MHACVRATIMHLNDQHGWSRESIADWLDTLPHELIAIDPDITTNKEQQ